MKIEQNLGDDDSSVEHHQQTENQLNRTTLERLNRSPSASISSHASTMCSLSVNNDDDDDDDNNNDNNNNN